ncbi:MAG TPA: hypothetical protein VFK05_00225 [Polyangiaceae bacterium]|nr:hypothetical protein [Polyangiaceae bacterium]
MARDWVGWFSIFLLGSGCGARTGLLTDSDIDQWASGGSGGASLRKPPVTTNCQLSGDDPRVAGIKPDELAHLDGADFVIGDVKSYHWSLQLEDCDAVVQNAQILLQGVDQQVLTFQPSRPAFYHFTLEVTGLAGDRSTCKLEVPVPGVGMRVELCWDTSTTSDLDLYLHTPYDTEPWFARGSHSVIEGIDSTTCNSPNAAAMLRFGKSRVDWGYSDSALSACNTPAFRNFSGIGRCPNPRSADDNNQQEATGTTERLQLDNPHDGQHFRVMVQNFKNLPAQPRVFVYCGGERAAAFSTPSSPSNFVAPNAGIFGVMWRAADITTSVDASGKVACSAVPVTDRAAVTIDDASF